MANALCAVTDELGRGCGTITVDGLRVTALRGVGLVGGGGKREDVGPLLELLGI